MEESPNSTHSPRSGMFSQEQENVLSVQVEMPSPETPPPQPIDGGAIRIERHYAQVIISGRLAPGTQLPPSNEIAKEWAVSSTAVQKAMRSLAASGLVERRRKSGTIVRNLKHRALVGVMVGPSLADETAHFYRALVTVLEPLINQRALVCRVYDGIHSRSLPASRNYRPIDIFKTDQIYHPFKGLILIGAEIPGVPEIADSELPKSMLHWDLRHTDVHYDHQTFVKDVFQRIADRGHRRALVISSVFKPSHIQNPPPAIQLHFDNAKRPPGLTVDQHVVQIIEKGWHAEKLVFDTMLELIAEWKTYPERKPQTIVLNDDVYARGACMALLKAGINVPEEMEIIVQANESIEHHYGMPVSRYEFSCEEIAKVLESILWKRITDEALPPLPVKIKGKFRNSDSVS